MVATHTSGCAAICDASPSPVRSVLVLGATNMEAEHVDSSGSYTLFSDGGADIAALIAALPAFQVELSRTAHLSSDFTARIC